jgi:hypothetical protein
MALKKLIKDVLTFISRQISSWVEDTQMDEPEETRSVRLESLAEINEAWSVLSWLSEAIAYVAEEGSDVKSSLYGPLF